MSEVSQVARPDAKYDIDLCTVSGITVTLRDGRTISVQPAYVYELDAVVRSAIQDALASVSEKRARVKALADAKGRANASLQHTDETEKSR